MVVVGVRIADGGVIGKNINSELIQLAKKDEISFQFKPFISEGVICAALHCGHSVRQTD